MTEQSDLSPPEKKNMNQGKSREQQQQQQNCQSAPKRGHKVRISIGNNLKDGVDAKVFGSLTRALPVKIFSSRGGSKLCFVAKLSVSS